MVASENLHIAVLMGGLSSERPVSLKSGEACANALERTGYKVSRIDVGRDLAAQLQTLQPDVCLNALHGKWGEDGCVQGMLELMNIPYTHSGVFASSIAMDKARAKVLFSQAGVPVAESLTVTRKEAAKKHALSPPYVLKPVYEGSSVGIFIVQDGEEIPPTLLQDGNEDDLLLAEKFVPGREFTCAVMGDQALAITEIKPADGYEFYDFDAKYADGGSIHLLPADIPQDLEEAIKRHSVRAHNAIGCMGVSRSDFIYDASKGLAKGLICLEINTQPGMTETSLVPEQAEFKGLTFEALVKWMIEDASCNR